MIADIITLIFSGISIVVSIFVFVKNQKLTKKYNNLVAGQQALQIGSEISSVRRRYEDLSLRCFSDNNEVVKHVFNSTLEDLCNIYDQACSLYIADKLDKDNFKKQYFDEIKNIVESPDFKAMYAQPCIKYQATFKVYNEWFNQEK